MIIKVCGMRDAQNIRDVAELDIDMMGFNFWPQSKRYVRMISAQAGIVPDYSQERLYEMAYGSNPEQYSFPKRIKRVGVFVDEMPQTIVTCVYNYSLDYIQLHGEEEPTVIDNLRSTLVPDMVADIKFIKAFGISCADDFKQCDAFEGKVDFMLFDYKTAERGGSGKHFDWSLLDAYQGTTPFLLSGGIGPDDAEEILQISHPLFAGVDVNSRFETAPAMKDAEALKGFVSQLRQH